MPVTPKVHLLKPLGAGGMGAVWLADHTVLKRHVVVKFMLGGMETNAAAANRFRREAEAAAQVKSPHVVQMHDYGVTEDGFPFIVMEHLEGHDLGAELTEKGALEPSKVIGIVQQVAKALAKVHAAGLLHRDIKPDNIFLCKADDEDEERFVKLLDFGIAKSAELAERDITLDGETKTGQVVGTPFYMSPEQVTAQKSIDSRSDLWALGVVTFEALTGQRPFDGPSFGALAVKIATGSPLRPSSVNPALPVSFDSWFAKACARDPADRFPTAKAMAEALREAFNGVVSLPPSGVMSDSSGERRVPTPEPSSPSASRRAPTPTELASTVNQATPDPSLARSDAGSAVPAAEESQKKTNTKLIGGLVVLAGVIAGVVALGRGPVKTGTPATTSTVSSTTTAKNAPPMVPSTAPSTTPSATPSATHSAAPIASMPGSASAAPSASTHPPRPIPVVAGKPIAPVKPAASTVKPDESAKPAPKPSTSGGDILY